MMDHLTKISEIEVTKNTAVFYVKFEIKKFFGDFFVKLSLLNHEFCIFFIIFSFENDAVLQKIAQ